MATWRAVFPQEIAKGRGPAPPPGFLAVVDYIAMTPAGKVFDSSLDKGAPYEIRVGGGQVRNRRG